jgi:trehalose 6-phosphate phosphatase
MSIAGPARFFRRSSRSITPIPWISDTSPHLTSCGIPMNHPHTILQDPELSSQIAQAPHLLFSLDFDGTLAPIVDRPREAALSAATKEVLRELCRIPGVTVAIVSGRCLDDVRSRVGIDGLYYSGNHGLEIDGPGFQFVHPRALALCDALRHIAEEIAIAVSSLDGVEIEWKRLTVSVHYRRASVCARREVIEILRHTALCRDGRFVVSEGKKVYDIRPRISWNKGDAVRLIRDRQDLCDALLIVAGDDSTDEDVFSAFDDAISICVAPRHQTAAHHTLASVDEVRNFLAGFITASHERRASAK